MSKYKDYVEKQVRNIKKESIGGIENYNVIFITFFNSSMHWNYIVYKNESNLWGKADQRAKRILQAI